MGNKYAENTSVAIGKSRGEIDRLLRKWDCDGIRWTDLFRAGKTVLEFTWPHETETYLARFTLELPGEEELRERARNAASGKFMDAKYQRILKSAGRQEHRVLLLFLTAAFNAVEAGIITAETIFLPFFVGSNGRTIAENALPRLPALLASGVDTLIEIPEVINAR